MYVYFLEGPIYLELTVKCGKIQAPRTRGPRIIRLELRIEILTFRSKNPNKIFKISLQISEHCQTL